MSQEKRIAEQEKAHKLFLVNCEAVLKTKAGKDLIWNILGMCGLYDVILPEQQTKLGRREVGLEILALLEEINPKLYPNLILNKQEA